MQKSREASKLKKKTRINRAVCIHSSLRRQDCCHGLWSGSDLLSDEWFLSCVRTEPRIGASYALAQRRLRAPAVTLLHPSLKMLVCLEMDA